MKNNRISRTSKVLALLLAIAMTLSACGGGSSTTDSGDSSSDSGATTTSGIPVLEGLEVTVDESEPIYTRMAANMITYTAVATLSDGTTQDVTDNCTASADLSEAGETTLSVRYSRNGTAVTAEVTINVQESIFVSDAVPEEYQATDCPEQGTVEHMTYTTYVYDADGNAGEEQENEVYIYLPYGYDPEVSYNILYLMHGGGENAGYWFGQGDYAAGGELDSTDENFTLAVLDNAIYLGYCEPMIVVTPCIQTSTDSGVNTYLNFRYEFKNDLVPAIESVYSTYANGDVSAESLIASRDHRAYDGLSMGSMTGFSSILMDCLDYVSYVGNFSGSQVDLDALEASLTGTYDEYRLNYWYNGNGDNDMAHDEHLEIYNQMIVDLADRLTEGEDYLNGDNCIFVDKPGKVHSYASWIVDLYNTLGVFFFK
ncbi:MAG: hypothetical protein LUE61_06050 [Clostridiales bacterium]|nr:hypothetical protein [Clostridiales bacterium]